MFVVNRVNEARYPQREFVRATRNPKSGIVSGQRKKSFQYAFSLTNHVAFVVRAKKFAQWKTGLNQSVQRNVAKTT